MGSYNEELVQGIRGNIPEELLPADRDELSPSDFWGAIDDLVSRAMGAYVDIAMQHDECEEPLDRDEYLRAGFQLFKARLLPGMNALDDWNMSQYMRTSYQDQGIQGISTVLSYNILKAWMLGNAMGLETDDLGTRFEQPYELYFQSSVHVITRAMEIDNREFADQYVQRYLDKFGRPPRCEAPVLNDVNGSKSLFDLAAGFSKSYGQGQEPSGASGQPFEPSNPYNDVHPEQGSGTQESPWKDMAKTAWQGFLKWNEQREEQAQANMERQRRLREENRQYRRQTAPIRRQERKDKRRRKEEDEIRKRTLRELRRRDSNRYFWG